jgi:hypothetical protein
MATVFGSDQKILESKRAALAFGFQVSCLDTSLSAILPKLGLPTYPFRPSVLPSYQPHCAKTCGGRGSRTNSP